MSPSAPTPPVPGDHPLVPMNFKQLARKVSQTRTLLPNHRVQASVLQFVMCMRVVVLADTMAVIAAVLMIMHGWSVQAVAHIIEPPGLDLQREF